MELIDTHCHLNAEQFSDDVNLVIQEALNENIAKILIPGTDIETSRSAIQLAEKYDQVYAAVGIHPNEGARWDSNSRNALYEMTAHPKVVAIGEIGLDYYWKDCPIDVQKEILDQQLGIAAEKNLPVILHSRDSLYDLLPIIKHWVTTDPGRSREQSFGVFHAFEGNWEQAFEIANFNMLVGIGGPVTYKNAVEKHELACRLSIDQMVLETDAPYLTPHPYRGKRNHPKYINLIAEKIAQIRNNQIKLVAMATTKNANRLFAWET